MHFIFNNNKVPIKIEKSRRKTIAINIVYKMKYDYKNITAFNVLAKYLGNSCKDYPSIEKFNKYIEKEKVFRLNYDSNNLN